MIAKLRYRRQACSSELCFLLLLKEEGPVRSAQVFVSKWLFPLGEDRWFKFGNSTEDVES